MFDDELEAPELFLDSDIWHHHPPTTASTSRSHESAVGEQMLFFHWFCWVFSNGGETRAPWDYSLEQFEMFGDDQRVYLSPVGSCPRWGERVRI